MKYLGTNTKLAICADILSLKKAVGHIVQCYFSSGIIISTQYKYLIIHFIITITDLHITILYMINE